MHSIHVVNKRERDSLTAERLRSRTEPPDLGKHRNKTRRLAQNYETRVDRWLLQTSDSRIEALPRMKLACHHEFRERSVDLELANPRVSPLNYTTERDRIEHELSRGPSSLIMRDRWTQKSGSLFREREPGKEIQLSMVFSHRSASERINDEIEKNPVMPLQPWTRFDNPIYRKFRGAVDPSKHTGGCDFDLYRSRGFGPRSPPPKNFLFSQMEFARPFGSRPSDFRPEDSGTFIEGHFYNVVPGYSPDRQPGKWRMDPGISGPPMPPKYWDICMPPLRSLMSAENKQINIPDVMVNRRGSELCSPEKTSSSKTLGSPLKGDVPYPQPKTYWKAITQVSNSPPRSARFYNEEVQTQKSFIDHSERAEHAQKSVLQHQGLTMNPFRGASVGPPQGGESPSMSMLSQCRSPLNIRNPTDGV
jgi:hypothetical protein